MKNNSKLITIIILIRINDNLCIEYLNDTSVSIMQQKSEKQKLVKINDDNNT